MSDNGNSNVYQKKRTIQRKLVLDSIHVERGEAFAPYDIEKLLDITRNSATHILASMADDGLLDVCKRKNSKGATVLWYKRKGADLIKKSWRKNPNFKPMPPYWRLGAPL